MVDGMEYEVWHVQRLTRTLKTRLHFGSVKETTSEMILQHREPSAFRHVTRTIKIPKI